MKGSKSASKLIHEIEQQPSVFVNFINTFTIVCSVFCYLFIAYLLIFHFPLIKLFFSDYSQLQNFIALEYKGPIFIIALFFNIILSVNPFAQIVPLTTIISFFYGFQKGFIFALTTVIISYVLTLYMSKRLGRKIVRNMIKEDNWEKVQVLANEEGVFPFFIAHLFPVFPDSIVAWIAGTTKLKFTKLTIASTIARIPGMLLTVAIGSGVITKNIYLTGGLFLSLVLISALLTKYRKNIMKLIDRNPS